MSPLPTNWIMKPLGSVATLQRGFDLPVQARREGPVTIFAANGPVGRHDVRKVKGPGVVTGRSGTLGKVHYVEEDYWPLNTALWVKDFHGNNPAWVYRLLTWMRLEQFTRGAGVPTLNRNLVHVVEVPLPPLAEQKRIAGILDAADALRAKRRESLAQLDILLQSTFLDMFGDPVTNPMGWDVSRFERIGSSRLGKMLDKGRESGNCQFPYLANFNVQWGRFELGELRQMDFDDGDREEFVLLNGDLLICEGGEVGRTAIWRGALENVYFQKALHRVRLDPSKAVPEFGQFFMWFMAKNGGFRDFTNSATIAHLTGAKLKGLPVPLPPLNLQRQFAAIVESVEHQKARLRTHLAELDALFASIQSRAFNGEL